MNGNHNEAVLLASIADFLRRRGHSALAEMFESEFSVSSAVPTADFLWEWWSLFYPRYLSRSLQQQMACPVVPAVAVPPPISPPFDILEHVRLAMTALKIKKTPQELTFDERQMIYNYLVQKYRNDSPTLLRLENLFIPVHAVNIAPVQVPNINAGEQEPFFEQFQEHFAAPRLSPKSESGANTNRMKEELCSPTGSFENLIPLEEIIQFSLLAPSKLELRREIAHSFGNEQVQVAIAQNSGFYCAAGMGMFEVGGVEKLVSFALGPAPLVALLAAPLGIAAIGREESCYISLPNASCSFSMRPLAVGNAKCATLSKEGLQILRENGDLVSFDLDTGECTFVASHVTAISKFSAEFGYTKSGDCISGEWISHGESLYRTDTFVKQFPADILALVNCKWAIIESGIYSLELLELVFQFGEGERFVSLAVSEDWMLVATSSLVYLFAIC